MNDDSNDGISSCPIFSSTVSVAIVFSTQRRAALSRGGSVDARRAVLRGRAAVERASALREC